MGAGTLCAAFDVPTLLRSAQSRQEICESFDWFRSYQGGVYFIKDIVKGYLLSAFSARYCFPKCRAR